MAELAQLLASIRIPDLAGKRVLITGASTGIGAAVARAFAAQGMKVGLHFNASREPAEKLAADIEASGGVVHLIQGDVSQGGETERVVTDAAEALGGLDGLVNNAAGNFLARTEDLSLRAFEAVLGIVLMGTIHCTLACGRRWLKAKHPATVLNISATYAPTGSAYVVPSATAKAGMEAFLRSLAVEWGDRGIRMNAIAPGPVPTEGAFSRLLPRPELEQVAKQRIPSGRFGTVEELANLAAFLMSDYSGYINGEVIRMDGGEFIQGAGEFTALGRLLRDEEWAAFKPKKSS